MDTINTRHTQEAINYKICQVFDKIKHMHQVEYDDLKYNLSDSKLLYPYLPYHRVHSQEDVQAGIDNGHDDNDAEVQENYEAFRVADEAENVRVVNDDACQLLIDSLPESLNNENEAMVRSTVHLPTVDWLHVKCIVQNMGKSANSSPAT